MYYNEQKSDKRANAAYLFLFCQAFLTEYHYRGRENIIVKRARSFLLFQDFFRLSETVWYKFQKKSRLTDAQTNFLRHRYKGPLVLFSWRLILSTRRNFSSRRLNLWRIEYVKALKFVAWTNFGRNVLDYSQYFLKRYSRGILFRIYLFFRSFLIFLQKILWRHLSSQTSYIFRRIRTSSAIFLVLFLPCFFLILMNKLISFADDIAYLLELKLGNKGQVKNWLDYNRLHHNVEKIACPLLAFMLTSSRMILKSDCIKM